MKFNEDNQIAEIVNYLKSAEKEPFDFKIGVEFEHFIIDKDTLRTITYYEEKGVKDTLKDLIDKEWIEGYEKDNIISMSKNGNTITLEPGSQIELSVKPLLKIDDIKKEYFNFLSDIIPILDSKNQYLIAIGYHPSSSINEIPFIPKKRYDFMSAYFKDKGKYAINMMKGTCSTQVTIDYNSESDFIKKFRVANSLTTVIASIFDNSPFFEGNIYEKNGLRTDIWNNCDNERCGIVKGVLQKDFGYSDYAKYILNIKPIVINKNNENVFTDNMKVNKLFNPKDYDIKDLEHILTMVFPDVRAKKFIEIRMADSVPFPYNLSLTALIKGLFYDDNNLNELYEFSLELNDKDIIKSKQDYMINGLNGYLNNMKLLDLAIKLIEMAKRALPHDEREYIEILDNMLKDKMNLLSYTRDNLSYGKKEAIKWCILNHKIWGEEIEK